MSPERFLINLLIVIVAIALMTIVYAWSKRKDKKEIVSITISWIIIISGILCFWVVISVIFKAVVDKLK